MPLSKTARSCLPWPQVMKSCIPSTASMWSSPLPPVSESKPGLPATRSSSSPPFTSSFPLPPLSRSLPPSPLTESTLPSPRTRSAPSREKMLSRPLVPYMVSRLFVPRQRPPSQLIVSAMATPLARSSSSISASSKRIDLFNLHPPSLRGPERLDLQPGQYNGHATGGTHPLQSAHQGTLMCAAMFLTLLQDTSTETTAGLGDAAGNAVSDTAHDAGREISQVQQFF